MTIRTSLAPEFITWVQDLRRELHKHPELSLKEVRTTSRVTEIMRGLGLEIKPLANMTGAVGILRGTGKRRAIALRADMDALPIQEKNEVSYRSIIDGSMHACGHDAHTAILLGVAKNLVDSGIYRKLDGDVVFIFQPAEEIGMGARMIIDQGVIDGLNIEKILACHVSGIEVGKVGICPGICYAASDSFQIKVLGKGGHGAYPHQTADPIVASAHLITALQTIISRNLAPTDAGVISVGRITAGEVSNVIPEHAHLNGTIRAFRQKDQEFLRQRLKEICSGIESSFRVTCTLDIKEVMPLCYNDQAVCDTVSKAAKSLWGETSVEAGSPVPGSEDFAFFTQKFPGAIIKLGCAEIGHDSIPVLHAPDFDIDERVLGVGVELFTKIASQYLLPE